MLAALMSDASPDAASVIFRVAHRQDLDAILALLADDAVARARTGYSEAATPASRAAFDEIERDPNNELLVGELDGELVATLQLTIIPGLSRGGMRRAQVEAVRVRAALRGRGIGERLMGFAIARARERGCGLMQLTTDVRRPDAHRFYVRLGFEASHTGMKRAL
jgi:GNAT superfamily N-acetyltransferase